MKTSFVLNAVMGAIFTTVAAFTMIAVPSVATARGSHCDAVYAQARIDYDQAIADNQAQFDETQSSLVQNRDADLDAAQMDYQNAVDQANATYEAIRASVAGGGDHADETLNQALIDLHAATDAALAERTHCRHEILCNFAEQNRRANQAWSRGVAEARAQYNATVSSCH